MQAQDNRLTTTDSQPILHQFIRASVLTFILLVCFGTVSIAQAAPLQQHTVKSVTTPVERAALLIHPQTEGATVSMTNEKYTFIATGKDTGGAYSLMEVVIGTNSGPPMHTHPKIEESFEVLEGNLTFKSDGKTIQASPGTYVNIPRGSVHAFHNDGDTPAKIRTLVVPAGIEDYFKEVGHRVDRFADPIATTPEDLKKLVSLGPKYGIEFVQTSVASTPN